MDAEKVSGESASGPILTLRPSNTPAQAAMSQISVLASCLERLRLMKAELERNVRAEGRDSDRIAPKAAIA